MGERGRSVVLAGEPARFAPIGRARRRIRRSDKTLTISRRDFNGRLLGAAYAGIAAGAPASGVSLSPSRPTAEGLRRDLSRLAGRVLVDDTSRRDAADDFGHLVHRLPLAVVSPSSVEDVAAVVEYASRRGITVAMNGNSHSVHGQAQARDGIVMLSRGLGTIHDIGDSRANQEPARGAIPRPRR